MRSLWDTIFYFCSVIYLAQPYKILGIFPHHGVSHFIVMRPLMEELVRRGHDVTIIGYFPLNQPLPPYKHISLEGTAPIFLEKLNMEDYYDSSRFAMYGTMLMLNEFAEIVCNGVFNSDKLDEIVKSSEEYDLIIAEMFNSDCFLPLNSKWNIPIIGISSSALLPWTYDRFGIPYNPSYIPNLLLDYPKKLNFFQRLENTVISWVARFYYVQWRNERDNNIAAKYFGKTIPHVSKFVNTSSLMLVNTHFSLNNARPYPPNVIEIGGIHLPSKNKSLPENIEKFITESPEGVIFFSLGSTMKADTLPPQKRRDFLRAFARLPQRVLWKWENETMPEKPDNVMLQNWLSQFDILSHPNVVAFICHGGLLGVIEAVQNGVPMLIMPQHGDQHSNARAVEDNGGGTVMYLKDVNEERLYQSLRTIIQPEFRARAKALSERFRDRPMSPMDAAVYWVEYVARHKGAPHMRSAVVDMPFYQYLLLDVFAFLSAVGLILMYITYKITILLWRIFERKKEKLN